MENKETQIAVTVAILVAIIFFGGWYIYFGRLFTGPETPPPITNTNPTIEPSGVITATDTLPLAE